MNMQNIQNVSDLAQLYNPLSLYLKPLAKFTISVALPSNVTGKSISNFEVMDKLRQMILPDKFLILKVSKSTIESLKFEAELDDRTKLKNVITRLDGRQIKLTGFTEYIKLRALESKDEFPTRHDWDSFFRDAKNMDEMKAGERPDTIYLSNLPIKWFCPRHQENENGIKPSENLFKRIFEKYGDVRCVDIPICDIYRPQMKSHMTGLKTFSFDNETYFEGYVQFSEYGAFVRAMDEFRGMKLVRKEEDKNVSVNIQVTFDKTKHLSDSSVKRRKVIRDRFIEKDRLKEADEEKRLKEIEDNKEKERKLQEAKKQAELDKQRQREEKRKKKYMEKINKSESSELTKKIRNEQKKLLKTQRKMESVRILEALFERIKMKYPSEAGTSSSKSFQPTDLRKKLEGKHKVATKEPMMDLKLIKKERSLSITSISSNDSCLSDSNINKTSMKKKKKKKQRSNSSSSSTSSSSNSSSSSSDSSSSNARKQQQMVHPGAAHGMFPGWMNNPETGEWYAAPGMYPGMYPFMMPGMPGMVPGMRPPFYQNPNYRGSRSNYNPRYQRGSRGGYRGRGRGNYHSYDVDQRHYKGRNDDDEYYNEHESRDGRRSYSRSPRSRRSYSRSRSRRRSYSRSRSRSRSRSSRSQSRKSKSHSRSRKSRSLKRSSSKNRLVSTLRDADTKKAPPTQRHKSNSKSRSRSRHSSASGWSSPGYRKSGKSGKSKRSWSKESDKNRSHVITLTPEKMMKSAREIQIHVQKKLQEQHDEQEKRKKQQERDENEKTKQENGLYLKRSTSVESDKFKSPKRGRGTPEMNIA